MILKVLTLITVLMLMTGCSTSGELQKSPCACGDKGSSPGLELVSIAYRSEMGFQQYIKVS